MRSGRHYSLGQAPAFRNMGMPRLTIPSRRHEETAEIALPGFGGGSILVVERKKIRQSFPDAQ